MLNLTVAQRLELKGRAHTLTPVVIIGNAGLHQIDQTNRCAEFGIVIGEKAFWGKGWRRPSEMTHRPRRWGNICGRR